MDSDMHHTRARTWALIGAVFLTAGAAVLYWNDRLFLQLLGLVLLAQGAKALRAGVDLQAGGDPAVYRPLVRGLSLTAAVSATLEVARVMGRWR